MQIAEYTDLKALNTFGVAIKTRYFCELTDINDCQKIAKLHKPLILGGGSNILFTKDYDGTTIHNCLKGITLFEETEDHVFIDVAAGENWHQWVLYSLAKKWYGLEALSLIPGTVGAAPIQNIGAYGVEVKSVIESVTVYNVLKKEIATIKSADCAFAYRDSFFKHNRHLVVVSVRFKLKKAPTVDLSYQALKEWFKIQNHEKITPELVSDAVIKIRQSKLPDPKIIGNAGSFFKNPIISKAHFEDLFGQYGHLIAYKVGTNEIKLVAGQLIELAGYKGKYSNNVGMYEKQALILVNLGNALGSTLLEYSQCVQAAVYQQFKVALEPEPLIL